MSFIYIDFTCFLNLNTICDLKTTKNKEIESNFYVK